MQSTELAAAERALAVPELLENILLSLPLRDLLLSSAVCKAFRDVAAGSIKIRRALFLEPATAQRAVWIPDSEDPWMLAGQWHAQDSMDNVVVPILNPFFSTVRYSSPRHDVCSVSEGTRIEVQEDDGTSRLFSSIAYIPGTTTWFFGPKIGTREPAAESVREMLLSHPSCAKVWMQEPEYSGRMQNVRMFWLDGEEVAGGIRFGDLVGRLADEVRQLQEQSASEHDGDVDGEPDKDHFTGEDDEGQEDEEGEDSEIDGDRGCDEYDEKEKAQSTPPKRTYYEIMGGDQWVTLSGDIDSITGWGMLDVFATLPTRLQEKGGMTFRTLG